MCGLKKWNTIISTFTMNNTHFASLFKTFIIVLGLAM